MLKKLISIVALILCVCLVFSGCDSVTTLLNGSDAKVEYKIENGEAHVKTVPNKSTVTEIVIPDEYEGAPVTKIADFSAANLEYVTKIYIGKNVNDIGNWSMTNNQHLTAFEVDENNPYYCDVDGVLYSKDMKTLIFYPPAKDLTEAKDNDGKSIKVSQYTILDGVEIICSKAFYKCNALTKIDIPVSVKKIEEKAFFRCERVEVIKLPDVLEFIGKDAFSYCYGLKEINIPASVNEIGEYAFYNCTNAKTVNVDNKESNIKLGEKWFPTDNGLDIKDLKINWK